MDSALVGTALRQAMQVTATVGATAFLFFVAIGILGIAMLLVPALQLRQGAPPNYFDAVRILSAKHESANRLERRWAERRRHDEASPASPARRSLSGAMPDGTVAGRSDTAPPVAAEPLAAGRTTFGRVGVATASASEAPPASGAAPANDAAAGTSTSAGGGAAADAARSDEIDHLLRWRDEAEAEFAAFVKDDANKVLVAKLEAMAPFLGNAWTRAPLVISCDVLVLSLALVMGALGGVISVAKNFVAPGPNPTLPDYFIRPLFGMVIAFVVFFLFKAGQVTISTNTSADSLNPFLIGILGVVSGLMAKDAIGTLEATAVRLLSPGNARGRPDGDRPTPGGGTQPVP